MSFIFLLMTFTVFVLKRSPCISLAAAAAALVVMVRRKIAHRSITMCVQVSTNVIHPFIRSFIRSFMGMPPTNTIQSNNYLAISYCRTTTHQSAS